VPLLTKAWCHIVLPLIVTAMILAVQNIKEMAGKGARLAYWTVGWYVVTTFFAIAHSCIMTGLVWAPMVRSASLPPSSL
jgi:Na+/H+-dicarboxylate symporter